MFRKADVPFVDNDIVSTQRIICEKVLKKAIDDVKHMKIAVYIDDYSNDDNVVDNNQEADDIRNEYMHDVYYRNNVKE